MVQVEIRFNTFAANILGPAKMHPAQERSNLARSVATSENCQDWDFLYHMQGKGHFKILRGHCEDVVHCVTLPEFPV